MRIVANHKLIRRNAVIGQVTSISAFGVLGIGMYISIKMPELLGVSLGALLLGFFLMQLGVYFGRWGRRPRPDELIDRSLKGLGREFTIYHYTTPVQHLLVGPAGIWVLLVYHQAGIVTYEKGRWRQRGGGVALAYLRIFGQESIGRPDLEAEAEIKALKRYLLKFLPEVEMPSIRAALLFAHPKAVLQAESAPIPAFAPKELKDFLRQRAKQKAISTATLDALRTALSQP